jgi:hypothetical protein
MKGKMSHVRKVEILVFPLVTKKLRCIFIVLL